MALVPLSLPLSSNPGRYDVSTRLINMMAEERGSEGKIPFPLYVVDGLSLFSTLSGGGKFRGGIEVGSVIYVVSGRQVFKVAQDGTATSLGGFAGDDPVFMAANQKDPPQIMMVSVGRRAIIESDVVSDITDTDLLSTNSVAFLNQRFVATRRTGTFQWSSLAEGTEWAALDFATAEYASDGLLRAFVRRGELLLFGQRTIEPWYNPASGDDVFAKSGTVIERGLKFASSVAMLEETPVFVADDGTVRALEGYSARRISTHPVERSLRDTTGATVEAFSYAKDGHSFYVITGDDFTWVYDATTGLWHERRSEGLNRWRANGYVTFGDKHIVGDYSDGKLYEITAAAYDENGADLISEVQIPLHGYPRGVQVNELRLNPVPGQGLNSSDEHDAEPKLMVKTSKNDGRTWGNERQRSMGRIGEYKKQVRFNRLGASKEDGFVISVAMSAAVSRGLTAASVDAQGISI